MTKNWPVTHSLDKVAPQGCEGFPCRQVLEGEASLWGDNIFLLSAMTLTHPGPDLDDLRGHVTSSGVLWGSST